MGPLRIHPKQEAKVLQVTIDNYKRHALVLTKWALESFYSPTTSEEWDDVLIEFLEAHPEYTLSKFTSTVAAVEFFFPNHKHHLPWARSVLTGWGTTNPTQHTRPMGKWPSKLAACHITSMGHPRLALGAVVQAHCGLRPSEMLNLQSEDIVMPDETGSSLERSPCLLGLGMRKGTKLKRAQVAKLFHKDRDVVEVLRRCRDATPPGQRLFPYTLRQYGRFLKEVEKRLQVDFGWTPHSARAGFATDCRTEGMGFREIMEAGRWQAETSLRVYLDILGASDISIKLRGKGLAPALQWAASGWSCYFKEVIW